MSDVGLMCLFNETFLCVEQSHVKPRERYDDPYTDYEDHCQNTTSFPLNGSSEQVGLFHRQQLSHG